MSVALEHVRVFTGRGLTPPTRVRIDGRLVGSDGAADEAIDATGQVLLPGLIDAHIHIVRGRADLAALADHGVTTGLDMGCWPAGFVDAMRHERSVARMRSATLPAVGPAGRHAALPGFPADGVVTSPEAARTFVARRVAEGADYLKIVTEAAPPEGLDQPTVDALAGAAHDAGLLVVAHAITTGAFRVAITAGVDVLTHAPLDAPLDDDVVARMAAAGTACCPTLTMMAGVARAGAAAGYRYEHAAASVEKLHLAGVPLLAGTDANSAPGVPFAPKHGESLHEELRRLVDVGLRPVEALAAATSVPSSVFGLDDRGAVTPGRQADLLLVAGDPTTDIAASSAIRGVWIGGERIR